LIKSMTGYGRGEFQVGDKNYVAEIKSVNHRYRDIVLRIPKTLQVIEDEIRKEVSSRVRRGRVEVFIQTDRNENQAGYELELNQPLVTSYLRLFRQLNDQFGLDQKISPEYLCQMKDVVLFKQEDIDIEETRKGIQTALEKALDSHDEMRTREGRATADDLRKRLDRINGYLDDIKGQAPAVVESYRKRLKEKIEQLSGDMEIDENRMLQEIATFSDRCDITEEIVRAGSHLEQFHKYMALDDAVGRRLDFLIQEINREVNTMGTKASDAAISARAVEIKAELEKIREHIQNVE